MQPLWSAKVFCTRIDGYCSYLHLFSPVTLDAFNVFFTNAITALGVTSRLIVQTSGLVTSTRFASGRTKFVVIFGTSVALVANDAVSTLTFSLSVTL